MQQLRFRIEEQPADTFYKDEGGKSNQLHFRISLQSANGERAELSAEDMAACGLGGGFLPLEVVLVFENGQEVDHRPNILEIQGGLVQDASSSAQLVTSLPCLSTASMTGGVRFRIGTVSKRVGNRGMGVRVSIPHLPNITPVTSSMTMVFSKRKNKERRSSTLGNRKLSLRSEDSDACSVVEAGDFDLAPPSTLSRQTSNSSNNGGADRKRLRQRNIYERMEDLDAEQKKLAQVVSELRKLNQQMQQVVRS